MIKRSLYKIRKDRTKLYRTYSDITPTLRQLPTGILYDCWSYKLDENGNETNEVEWEQSGVIDVENAPYTYEEVTLND